MKRFTIYDDETGTYGIETKFNHPFKCKKGAVIIETRPATCHFGAIEDLLEKYKVRSLFDLECILRSHNKKITPKGD